MDQVLHPAARCVDPAGAELGEGPIWVAGHKVLYWVDIKGRRVHAYNPASQARRSWETPFRIGAIAPRRQGGFVGASEHGFVLIDPEFSRFDLVGDPEPSLPGNRFNDGKVDPRGRFWAGTMDDAEQEASGALYRLDSNLEWHCEDRGYLVTNGPAFSPDGCVAYHTDSAARTIFRFDMNPDGELGPRDVLATFGEEHGHPDGMTTDVEGCLWVAFWDGWCVRRVSPAGDILQTIEMPVQRPTSCAFGGNDLDLLFVTSASIGIAAPDLTAQLLAGGLFIVDVGAKGFASPPFGG